MRSLREPWRVGWDYDEGRHTRTEHKGTTQGHNTWGHNVPQHNVFENVFLYKYGGIETRVSAALLPLFPIEYALGGPVYFTERSLSDAGQK